MIRLKVKEIAAQKGMSQGSLSRLANIDIRTLRKIYRNPTEAIVTTDTLDRLAMALPVDVSELIESVLDNASSESQRARAE
jgi:DNA-binding Xre family transcriptional regulator